MNKKDVEEYGPNEDKLDLEKGHIGWQGQVWPKGQFPSCMNLRGFVFSVMLTQVTIMFMVRAVTVPNDRISSVTVVVASSVLKLSHFTQTSCGTTAE